MRQPMTTKTIKYPKRNNKKGVSFKKLYFKFQYKI